MCRSWRPAAPARGGCACPRPRTDRPWARKPRRGRPRSGHAGSPRGRPGLCRQVRRGGPGPLGRLLLPELDLLRMDGVTEDVGCDPVELVRDRGHPDLVPGVVAESTGWKLPGYSRVIAGFSSG